MELPNTDPSTGAAGYAAAKEPALHTLCLRWMKRFLGRFFGRAHARAEIRRKRAVQRAKAERERDDTHGGSIWRSGKGGSHIG
jgi:hypothetical protein